MSGDLILLTLSDLVLLNIQLDVLVEIETQEVENHGVF